MKEHRKEALKQLIWSGLFLAAGIYLIIKMIEFA